MSFCCGSDMLLTIASIRQHSTTVLNVPMLFCLACDKVMIHPDIEWEYDLLREYAISDRTAEVDLAPHLSQKKQAFFYDPKNHAEYLRLDDKLREHIDRTLDLYSMAYTVDDPNWKDELINRLSSLQLKSEQKRNS